MHMPQIPRSMTGPGRRFLLAPGGKLLALGGLAMVDILLLLPLLFATALIVLVLGLVTFVLRVIGIGALLRVFELAAGAPISKLLLHAWFGIGLISASVAVTMLLLFAVKGAVAKLGGFVRLHYRVLKPERPAG